MADATSNLSHIQEYYPATQAVVKTSEVLVVDGMAAINLTTGKMENAGTEVDLLPVGLVVTDTVGGGTPAAMTGDGTVEVIAKSGMKLKNVSVTGASAITDFGKLVYASDNQTYTLTKPTAGVPVGYISKWNATTYCDIQLFTPAEILMWSVLPQKETIYLGYVSAQSLGGTAAADLLTYTAGRRMQLDTLRALPQIDDAAVAGDQDLNLEIGAVNVTGTLTLAYTDCDALADLGTAVEASLTANNIVSQGEVITLELAASGTAFTDNTVAGFNIYLDVTYLAGS
uniref:Tail protein n=1 Tax=viral metagenome TaxID=1070528 RepID=A0A6H1ZFP4_9ZZZZ